MIFTSVPVYFVFISWKSKPKCFQRAVGKHNLRLSSPAEKRTIVLSIVYEGTFDLSFKEQSIFYDLFRATSTSLFFFFLSMNVGSVSFLFLFFVLFFSLIAKICSRRRRYQNIAEDDGSRRTKD